MKGLKSLGILLAALIAAALFAPAEAKAAGDVAINKTNFPDATFREYLSSEDRDKNGDGKLSQTEIAAITFINLEGRDCANLKGIEYFTELDVLDCYGNNLKSLDISKNTKLTILECSENSLTTLDISKNTALTDLYCSGNSLTSLNVSNNTKLKNLFCEYNQLKTLDVTKNVKLFELSCSGNQLTKLNLSNNTALVYLTCGYNSISSLNVSALTKLKMIDCRNCDLSSLDISANTKLREVYCSGTGITKLDIHLAPCLMEAYSDKDRVKTIMEDCVWYELAIDWDDEGDPLEGYVLVVPRNVKVATAVPTISTQPKSKTVDAGSSVTFKVAGEGGGLTYQWYYKKPGDTSWTKVSSTAGKKASYTFTVAARHYKYQYRCKVANAAGSKFSDTVTLTVNTKPVITSPTAATTLKVKKGEVAKFTVKAQAAETYQWYYKTPDSTVWKKVSATSGTTAAYKLTAAARHNGYKYRCKVMNQFGYTYTKVYTLKVTS